VTTTRACVVCGGPPPGARIVHTLFVCRSCLEKIEDFPDAAVCFWCREDTQVHHFPGVRGAGGLPTCRACRDSFVKQLAVAQTVAANPQPQEK